MSEGIKKYCAEFIGTFVLVLVACGVQHLAGLLGEVGDVSGIYAYALLCRLKLVKDLDSVRNA